MNTTKNISKDELFSKLPIPEALFTMAVPTVISQLINLIYNVVDAFFIGRTGNSYMMAATSVTLTMVMMNTALSNLFGIGGGSHVARLMGQKKTGDARSVSAFSFWGAIATALTYSALTGVFLDPLLRILGASDATIGYAHSYALIVIVIGSLPAILSLALAHLLRNSGFSLVPALFKFILRVVKEDVRPFEDVIGSPYTYRLLKHKCSKASCPYESQCEKDRCYLSHICVNKTLHHTLMYFLTDIPLPMPPMRIPVTSVSPSTHHMIARVGSMA